MPYYNQGKFVIKLIKRFPKITRSDPVSEISKRVGRILMYGPVGG